MHAKPSTRPPNITPVYCPIMKGTGPQFIRQHIGLLVYIWTIRGNGFWFYPTGIRNGVLLGYIWKNMQYQPARLNISQIDCLY